MKKYAILTSNSCRHAYFTSKISEFFHVNLVIAEEKPKLKGRSLKREQQFFSQYQHSSNVKIMPRGSINSREVREELISAQIDVAFVFGTGILKKEIIDTANECMINVHTGLTQHYRGVDSTFWAFYNDDIDKIGSTIHLVNRGIDTGRIIYQIKPVIKVDDDPDTIFMRLCKDSTDEICKHQQEIESGMYNFLNVKPTGKLYNIRDKTTRHVSVVEETFKSRIERFLNVEKNS